VVFGSGSSPLLLGDKVIVNAYTESQKLVAFDKVSGKKLWESEINGMCWSTPVVAEPAKGKREIILNVNAAVQGFDADSGQKLWSADSLPAYNSATPLVRGDLIYVMNQAQGEREFLAVRA